LVVGVVAVFGLELAAGYLAAWAVRKARRVAGRVDERVDAVTDAALDRLYEVVAEKLGADPALARLEAESTPDGEPGERTLRRVEDAVAQAAEDDADFARDLEQALRSLAEREDAPPGGTTVMRADARGHARVYQAGRDQHIGGP
jgi:hypothetical protein